MSVTFYIEHRVNVWTLQCACGGSRLNGSFKKHRAAEVALEYGWLKPCSNECESLNSPGNIVVDELDAEAHTITLSSQNAYQLLEALRLTAQGTAGSIKGVVFNALASTAKVEDAHRSHHEELMRIGSYAMTHNAEVVWA